MMPPITAIAIGARKDPPSPTPSADGSIPADMAIEVMMIGRARLRPVLDHGFDPRHALVAHLDREVDQQDGVLRHDAHQHQDADQDGHGERVVGDQKGHRDAADGERAATAGW